MFRVLSCVIYTIDPPSIKKIRLILNHMKKSGKGYYYYYFIKSNWFGYVWYWQPQKGDFSSWLQKKTIENKEKCNQLNILYMQYMLGNNCRMP